MKCPKMEQDKNFYRILTISDINLKSGGFSAKIEKGSPYRVIRTGY